MNREEAVRFLVTLGVEYAQTFKESQRPVVQETLLLRINAAAEALHRAATGEQDGNHPD